MNDFTKQELECLANAIELQLQHRVFNEINEHKRVELVKKIQKLINSYCDHPNSYSDSNYHYGCSDCGRIWG